MMSKEIIVTFASPILGFSFERVAKKSILIGMAKKLIKSMAFDVLYGYAWSIR
ncbi:hypothetical protein Sjap_020809 [Stephania japonica]|uniref:Uncharacterized protein n=1 Tax=Stephania japonica TaxID=461633 RepID=A0AAP0F1E9_9MAGN